MNTNLTQHTSSILIYFLLLAVDSFPGLPIHIFSSKTTVGFFNIKRREKKKHIKNHKLIIKKHIKTSLVPSIID